jgi:hypothetical protein
MNCKIRVGRVRKAAQFRKENFLEIYLSTNLVD